MNAQKQKINTKLRELGQRLGLDETTSLTAKRNTKNIIAMAIFAGIIVLLGANLLPGGPGGYYYCSGSIRDFHLLLKGLF